jgi:hypothetical protein
MKVLVTLCKTPKHNTRQWRGAGVVPLPQSKRQDTEEQSLKVDPNDMTNELRNVKTPKILLLINGRDILKCKH